MRITIEQHGTGPDKILLIMGCAECSGLPEHNRTERQLGSTRLCLLGCIRWNTLQRHTPSSSLTTEVLDIVIPRVVLTRWSTSWSWERRALNGLTGRKECPKISSSY